MPVVSAGAAPRLCCAGCGAQAEILLRAHGDAMRRKTLFHEAKQRRVIASAAADDNLARPILRQNIAFIRIRNRVRGQVGHGREKVLHGDGVFLPPAENLLGVLHADMLAPRRFGQRLAIIRLLFKNVQQGIADPALCRRFS